MRYKASVHRVEDEFLTVTEYELGLLMGVPVCGCGDPPALYELYREFLRAAPRSPAGTGFGPLHDLFAHYELLAWAIGGVLDHIGAIDHGGTLRFAWRTEKGDQLLALLDRWAQDYGLIPAMLPVDDTPTRRSDP